MRRTGLFSLALALGTIVFTGCSKTPSEERLARGVGVGTGGAAAHVKGDAEFVHDVAIMHMAAVELSRLALNQAASPNIKAFAQQLIADHEGSSGKLRSVISGGASDWPAQLDEKHRERADELAKKTGADFDREYVKAIVEGHQNLEARLESRLDVQSLADWKAAAAGRTQSQALPDPAAQMQDVQLRPNKSDNELTTKINQWAAETYPVAQKHLDSARTLENATEKR